MLRIPLVFAVVHHKVIAMKNCRKFENMGRISLEPFNPRLTKFHSFVDDRLPQKQGAYGIICFFGVLLNLEVEWMESVRCMEL